MVQRRPHPRPLRAERQADLITSEYNVAYRINRFGYRDHVERKRERTPGLPRVALLGDSFSEGVGVEQDRTFAYLLEQLTGVEVVNVGRNGSSPLSYLFQARHVIESFDPDLLLIQIFDNDLRENDRVARVHTRLDVSRPLGPLPKRLRPGEGRWRRLARALRARTLVRRAVGLRRALMGERTGRSRFVEPGSRSNQPVLTREEVISANDIDLGPHSWEEIAVSPRMPIGDLEFYDPAGRSEWTERFDLEERLLVQLVQESRAAGVPVVVIYIPVYLVFLTGLPVEDIVAQNPHDQLLRRVCERESLVFLDGIEILGQHARPVELYYPVDGHLNTAGHAFLAEALAEHLRTVPPFSGTGSNYGAKESMSR